MFNNNQSQQGSNVQPVAANVSVTQQAQQQRAQGFPSLPTPTEPNLFNNNPNDIDFGYDEASGQFQMFVKDKKPDTSTQPIDQSNETVASQQMPQSNGYDDKFVAIDNQMKMFGDALVKIAGYLDARNQGQQQQTQQQQSMSLDIQSDDFATNLVSVINNAIDTKLKSFEDRLAPLQQTNSQMNDRMIIADLAMQHGQPFLNNILPVITELKKSDPNLDIRTTALALLKTPLAKQDSTIRTDNGSNQQAQGGQPQSVQNQNLQQRANQLATETGGVPRSVVSEEVPGKTIADAANKAFRDLGLI